jgi:hypothetical protein
LFQLIRDIKGLVMLLYLIGYFSVNVYASTISQNQNKQPRYVSGVISIIQEHSYIRNHDSLNYWRLSSFYLPQPTDASCSSASAAMVLNALRIPQIKYANQKLITTNNIAHSVNKEWGNEVKQGGNGVTLEQLGAFLKQAINVYQIPPINLEVIHATKGNEFAIKFHQALMDSENLGRTFLIINFNQKFISGTESVGHFAPVGAYDANTKRVLLMDPDRELFEPYWVPESNLLYNMLTKDFESKKNRGFIIIKLK